MKGSTNSRTLESAEETKKIIDKEGGAGPVELLPLERVGHDGAKLLNPRHHGIHGDKMAFGRVGDDHGQGRFAGSGRAIKYQG